MATYVNDLRLTEIATGDESGTWGTITNTNLELIGEGLSYGTQDCFTTDADATTTVLDGGSDPARAMYFKVTSSATLTATRTLTIAPNTVSRVQFIENATTGSQSINISQGSGSNVTIPNGQTKAVYMDGAGATAAVVDAFSLLNLTLADNVQLNFGTGNDLSIFHDGSNSYITETGTGDLRLRATNLVIQSASEESLADFTTDGAVTLYYDNSAKLATTTNGISVTGDVFLADNERTVYGAGEDLVLFHDAVGGGSYINEQGTGDLNIQAADIIFKKYGTSEVFADFNADGAVELYYDNNKKIETTSTGVTVTGTAIATTDTDTTNTGNVTLDFGANQNFVLTLTGNVTLDNPTTEQVGQSGFIVFIQDGTGGRTVTLGTDYETAGGAGLTLSSTASTTDIVPYVVAASGRILLGAPQLAFS